MDHEMTEQATKAALDATIASVGNKVTAAGFMGSILGWLTSSQGLSTIGAVAAILGAVVGAYFKYREYKWRREEHIARMRVLEDGKLDKRDFDDDKS